MKDMSAVLNLSLLLISFGLFLYKNRNMLAMLIIGEAVWVLFYVQFIILGSLSGLITPLVISLFALATGGFEASIFIILLKLFSITRESNLSILDFTK